MAAPGSKVQGTGKLAQKFWKKKKFEIKNKIISSLFLNVTLRRLAVIDVLGQPLGSIFKGQLPNYSA